MTTASALISSLAGAPAQTHQAARARKTEESASTQAIQRVGDLIEIHLRAVEEGTDQNSAAQLRINPRSQRQPGSSTNPREQNRNPQQRNKQQPQQQQLTTTTGPGSEDHPPGTTPAPGSAPGIFPGSAPGNSHATAHGAASGYAASNPGPTALYKHLDIKA
jgi:hypothetical protein